VLEAGQDNRKGPQVSTPALWTTLVESELDWQFKSTQQVRLLKEWEHRLTLFPGRPERKSHQSTTGSHVGRFQLHRQRSFHCSFSSCFRRLGESGESRVELVHHGTILSEISYSKPPRQRAIGAPKPRLG
jgi:hypothetical protein